MSRARTSTSLLEIGQIVGPHGLKGQFKVEPYTDLADYFDPGMQVQIEGEWYEIESGIWHKNRPLLKLEGVDSVEAAEELRWKKLSAEPLEDLDEDAFRIGDLLECSVVTAEGEHLGQLDEVLVMPAHDVYRVGEIMIPAVKEFVQDVDLDEKRIVVKLIPGMRGEEMD